MIKIAHIADVHIRNYKYHREYKAAFDDLYCKLREEKPDIICVLGDIAHTKTDISPEFVEMTTNFFTNLGSIASTKIILGNHDLNLKNKGRQDAITPIISALGDKNVELWKYSGGYEPELYIKQGERVLPVNFNVLSILDPENWQKPKKNAVNIALYHGSISGCKVDNGWTMEKGDNEVDCFDGHDLVLLGDIHKRQQLDKKGRIAYPGSLIQQNFSEEVEKGFLIWEVNDKEHISSKFITVENIRPFINVIVDESGYQNEDKVKKGCRLRLVFNKILTGAEVQSTVEYFKKYKPESISVQNNAGRVSGVLDSDGKKLKKDDFLQADVQGAFIRDFLLARQVSDENIEAILQLNKKYNLELPEKEKTWKNIQWDIEEFQWDNLFNYGEANRINFKNLSGIVGIFGKNYSGKSSVIDSILFTMYNNTTKKVRKNISYINNEKDRAHGLIQLKAGKETYSILRTLEKYRKLGKDEARSTAQFVKTGGEVLNSLDKRGTDREIQSIFGNFDDFLLTSVSSQLDSLSFINEGSTKRKEVLSRFLGLDIFDKIMKLAKVEARDIKGMLKKTDTEEHQDRIEKLDEELDNTKCDLKDKIAYISTLDGKKEEYTSELGDIERKLEMYKLDDVDIVGLRRKQGEFLAERQEILSQLGEYSVKIEELENKLEKLSNFVAKFDSDKVRGKKSLYEQKKQEKTIKLEKIRFMQERIDEMRESYSIVERVPCKGEFPSCQFLQAAVNNREQIPTIEQKITSLKEQVVLLERSQKNVDIGLVEEDLQKYEKALKAEKSIEKDLGALRLKSERQSTRVDNIKRQLDIITNNIEEFSKREQDIEKIKELRISKEQLLEKLENHALLSKKAKNEESELIRRQGSCEAAIELLNEELRKVESLRKQHSLYEHYVSSINTNGIPYMILKDNLSLINGEIEKILAGMVEFRVFFASEEERLEIYLEHPGQKPRLIELGSGAEKTVAAIAVRIALTNFSNLPKPNFFILDEPGTALDAENLSMFDSILDILRQQFRFTLLITHIDSMKDSVDKIIEVNVQDSFACINE